MADLTMTPKQIDMARHALGLTNATGRWRKSYRNHYCAGFGTKNWWRWMLLVWRGLATHRATSYFGIPLQGGVEWSGDFFYLTRGGAEMVLRSNEKLCPEDFPAAEARAPSKTR